MNFCCWAVFVDDAEDPVYIWDDEAMQLFALHCVDQGREVEILCVFR